MKRIHLYPALFLWAVCAVAQPVKTPKAFPTPQAAAHALLTAAETNNTPALASLFGAAGKDLIQSGDPVQDKHRRELFAERAKQKMHVNVDKQADRATILIGEDSFPFPVPIVRTGKSWRFDPQHGKRELLARRIGSNEIDAIDLCAAYVQAQYKFASEDPERSGVNQYAQRFISSAHTRDGLYWPAAEGAPVSPIASLVDEAAQEGYDVSGAHPVPYHGYRFRILKAQGSRAMGGARDYMANGMMIGGFGMVAWPAEYGASGIKTFVVNQDGLIYEKDLGPHTTEAANAIRAFNPDASWKVVK